MAKGIGPTAKSNAVKNALRHCRRHPCECLAEAMERLINGHDTGQGWNKGIGQRIDSMLAPGADPPGTIYNGKDTWQTHTDQIQNRRNGLDNLQKEYDAQNCGNGPGGNGVGAVDPAALRDALNRPIPTPQDYWNKFPKPAQSTGPSMLKRVGYAVGGTLLLAGAAALVFVPFDGPVGEYAAGAAGLGAWGLATQ